MKSKLLLLVGAVVFLGIISLVFLPKPKKPQQQTTPLQTPTQTVQTTGTRQKIDCSFYGKMQNNNFKYITGDMGNLPKDFPTAPRSQLCGSVKEQKSVYYITSLSDEELFAYFKKILTGRSCTVSDVIKNNVIKTQSYITFIYSGAEGLIAPDPFHSAYSVLYPLR